MQEQAILEILKRQEQNLKQIQKSLINMGQTPTTEVDLEKVAELSQQLRTSIAKVDEVIEVARKPVVSQKKFTIEILSKSTITIFIGMIVVITLLFVKLYFETRPNYDQRDNDLKYRYIKMKGEASPTQIEELENIFEINRDNKRIEQMWEDVTQFEDAVQKKALLDEQVRLKAQEATEQGNKANELKQK